MTLIQIILILYKITTTTNQFNQKII